MFKNIYLPIDNSDYSNTCIDIGIDLAKRTGAYITASHVFAAKMHELRFKQMESGLPEEYQVENELEKQRDLHDQLIAKGMEVITESYLDVPQFKCKKQKIPFACKSLEGRNWVELVKDINQSSYDLVIMGILGLGATRESQIGTVAERVVRRIQTDTLLVKKVPNLHRGKTPKGNIIVAVDGSGHSFGGLKTGIRLAKLMDRPLEIISVLDPFAQYDIDYLTGILPNKTLKIWEYEHQEKLCKKMTELWLALIGRAHLEISQKIVKEEGFSARFAYLKENFMKKSFNIPEKRIRIC
ncbi:MAG: universal stress protein [Nitrospinales bacterium]